MRLTNSLEANQATQSDRFVASSFVASPRAYGPTATYASKSLTVVNRVNRSQLKGAQFFLAFGSKFPDVARNQTYSLIYTAP